MFHIFMLSGYIGLGAESQRQNRKAVMIYLLISFSLFIRTGSKAINSTQSN